MLTAITSLTFARSATTTQGLYHALAHWKAEELGRELARAYGDLTPPGRERRHDVLVRRGAPQRQPAPEQCERAALVGAADPADPPARQRQAQLACGIAVGVEPKARGDPRQRAVERGQERAGKARAVAGERELGVRPLVHEPALEARRDGCETSESRGGKAAQHPLLPERVEALDIGVAARLALRDEAHLDAEQQRQADRRGEDPPARREPRDRGLVVDLPDARQAKPRPGALEQVAAEALATLVAALPGRDAPATDVDGVEAKEAHRSARRAQVAWSDEVGLLQVAGSLGPRPRVRSAGALVRHHWTRPRPAGTLEDPLDRPSRRPRAHARELELPGHRVGAAAFEAAPTRQPITRREHRADDRRRGLSGLTPRRARPTTQTGRPRLSEAAPPLRQPLTAALKLGADIARSTTIAQRGDRPATSCLLVHRFLLGGAFPSWRLESETGSGAHACQRCDGGLHVSDVLTGTPYPRRALRRNTLHRPRLRQHPFAATPHGLAGGSSCGRLSVFQKQPGTSASRIDETPGSGA